MAVELRLYVIGQRSPDPSEWDDDLSWALVIASDAEEASRLAGDAIGPALEVPMGRSMRLLFRSGDGGWPEDSY